MMKKSSSVVCRLYEHDSLSYVDLPRVVDEDGDEHGRRILHVDLLFPLVGVLGERGLDHDHGEHDGQGQEDDRLLEYLDAHADVEGVLSGLSTRIESDGARRHFHLPIVIEGEMSCESLQDVRVFTG